MTDTVAVARTFDDLQIGEELPELRLPITRTLIVSTAIASRDYQDVHHDPGLAAERGSPDIFMNILTTNGFVGRFITDWAGPDSVITSVAIRLGVPNYPGDTMVMSGRVAALRDVGQESALGARAGETSETEDIPERGEVEVSVRGANSRGDHVTGTVILTLPRSPTSSGRGRGRR